MALWRAFILSGTGIEEGAVVGASRFRCHRNIVLCRIAVVAL